MLVEGSEVPLCLVQARPARPSTTLDVIEIYLESASVAQMAKGVDELVKHCFLLRNWSPFSADQAEFVLYTLL